MNNSLRRYLRTRERFIHVSVPLLPIKPLGSDTTVMVAAPNRKTTSLLGLPPQTSTRFTNTEAMLRAGHFKDELYTEDTE